MKLMPRPITLSDQQKERFWTKVLRGEGCWEWLGYRQPNGYGMISQSHTSQVYAHRVAWVIKYGPIPEDMCVLHRCDNPSCVRPDHLFLGTRAENHQDMVKKGRMRRGDAHPSRIDPSYLLRGDKHPARTRNGDYLLRGEKHPSAKLTEDQVREIRASSESNADLARKFGVQRKYVWALRRGKNWRSVA